MVVDLSPYQQPGRSSPPDFEKMKTAGVRAVILRAFEGATPDRSPFGYDFHRLRIAAIEADLVVGSYQYFRARHTGEKQARLLLEELGYLLPRELPPALDVEELDGRTPEEVRQGVLSWVRTVREAIGEPPILYTGPAFWSETLRGGSLVELSDCPLWIADYRARPAPEIPKPWKSAILWQTTGSGRVDGVTTAVDLNTWTGPGTVEDFAARRC